MEVYIVFTVFLFLFSFFELFKIGNGKFGNIFLFLSFLGAVLIVGGRWYTGTDWEVYEYLFNESATIKDALDIWKTEIGYGILSWLVRSVTDDYSVFLIIHAVLFYGLLIISFKKIIPYPQTAFFYYFTTNLGMVGANRQLLGIVFLLFGLSFLLNNNKKKFFVLLFSSFTFHATAYLASVYYFFNRYISKKVIIISIIVAFLFGISPLPLQVFGSLGALNEHFMSKTEAYLDSAKAAAEEYGLTVAGALKRILFLIIFLGIRDKAVIRLKNYNLFFNGYWMGILVYLVFSSSLNVMVSRGSLYFNLMEPLLIACIFLIVEKPIEKCFCLILVFIVSILLMYQSIGGYPDAFDPYKGIWYNQDFVRRPHR